MVSVLTRRAMARLQLRVKGKFGRVACNSRHEPNTVRKSWPENSKVFLSSTAQDLTGFRKAVHARLAASPLFEAVRQEDFDLQSNAAVDLCHQQVQKADLFIGLVGMRRGWEPPGDPDRRSITEMEYDWAKAVAPRFLYVAPQGFPVPGNLRESDAQHRRQIDFRQRVMSELVVSQDGFVSPEKRPTPDIFARRVVDD